MYQLPNFACYSHWCMMIVLDAYGMLWWLVHYYYTRNAWLPVMRFVHVNEVVKRCKYQMLVWHVTVSAWKDIVIMKYIRYMSHFIGLLHINDLVVISTWWLRQMHICILQVSRLWWHAKFVCYSCCIEITLIGSVWILFLLISVEFNFNRNLWLLHGTWNFHWNSNL